MSQGYDFGQLYSRADMSSGVRIPEDVYDAVCTKCEWGRSKDGTKGQWTAEHQITTGQFAGTKMTNNITISPVKNDGTENARGLGAMFRHLAAHNIPVPPAPGQPGGFWELGWTPEQVAATMVGKPVSLVVKDDEYDGVTRSKIRDYQPPKPGAPTQVQQAQQAPQYPPPNNGFAQNSMGGYGQGQPYQPGPTAPAGWQNAQQPPQGIPGAPDWAQPPVPGAGGLGEFTPQGQSYQPSHMAPSQQPGYPQQQGGPYGQPNADWNPTSAPAQHPFAQGGQPQQGVPGTQAPAQPGYPPQGQPPYGAPASGALGQGAPYQQGAPSPSNMGQPAMPGFAQQQQPPQQGQPPQDPNAAPPPPWAQ